MVPVVVGYMNSMHHFSHLELEVPFRFRVPLSFDHYRFRLLEIHPSFNVQCQAKLYTVYQRLPLFTVQVFLQGAYPRLTVENER